MLLKALSVIDNFLSIFQKFNEISLRYNKHNWGVVYQT